MDVNQHFWMENWKIRSTLINRKGFSEHSEKVNFVCGLEKALYELNRALILWYSILDRYIQQKYWEVVKITTYTLNQKVTNCWLLLFMLTSFFEVVVMQFAKGFDMKYRRRLKYQCLVSFHSFLVYKFLN